MTMSDVSRIIEIERLAYPSTWPPSAYRKELQENRWAHYIVLRDKHIAEEQMSDPVQGPERHRRFFRSEERRVGKECRSRWSREHLKKNRKEIDVYGWRCR